MLETRLCAELRAVLSVLLLTLAAFCVAATLDPAALQQQLIARFGPARITLLKDWQQVVASAKSLSEDAKLKRINDFFNQNVAFDDDMNIWQQSDSGRHRWKRSVRGEVIVKTLPSPSTTRCVWPVFRSARCG
jgi:predicted transglutaminase-like cysteine proteinase